MPFAAIPFITRKSLLAPANPKAMKQLVKEFKLCTGASPLLDIVGVVGSYYPSQYRDEIVSLAEASGVSRADAWLTNHAYELGQMGCTVRVDKGADGLALRRVLDWPMPATGKYAVAVETPRAVNVTVPGFVGIVTALKKGAYAVALNAAPACGQRDIFSWAPTMLLRHVVEECDTYEEAVETLGGTSLMTGAFFTVVAPDRACVIERTCHEAAVRKMRGATPLVAANHYVSPDFAELNEVTDSQDRYTAMRKSGNLRAPVLNELTTQVIDIVPGSGKVVARARV